MAKPGGMIGQMMDSFEQIGQDVARETVQAPKDMVGKALESIGVSSGKKKTQQQTQQAAQEAGTQPEAPSNGPSEEVKRAIARAALEEISGKRPKQQEESVWERMKKEEEQKKQMEKQRREAEKKASLPQVSSKRKRGDLYGKQAKKTQVENRNQRQD